MPGVLLDVTENDGDNLATPQTITVTGTGFQSNGFGTSGDIRQCADAIPTDICSTSAVRFTSNSQGGFTASVTVTRIVTGLNALNQTVQIDCATTTCRVQAVSDNGAFESQHHISFAAGAPAAATLVTTATSSAAVGQAITDTATVAGPAAVVAPTGTVTFDLYGPADPTCAGPPVFTSASRPLGGGPPPTATSAPFQTQTAGTYRWIARYSGDANYAALSGSCGDPNESSVVTAAGGGPGQPGPPGPPGPPGAPGASQGSEAQCRKQDATILGTPGDDSLVGTSSPDVIAALGGADVVRALGGDDLVCGGRDDDTLKGGQGDDFLRGGSGVDLCAGGPGTDDASRSCQEVSGLP
jgi:hypothetical protein